MTEHLRRPLAFLIRTLLAIGFVAWGGTTAGAEQATEGGPTTAAGLPAEAGLEPFLGPPRFEKQSLFQDQRLPNVVVTTDGTVLAVWGWGQVRVRRSEDGGETWGPVIGLRAGLNSGGAVVDETTGDVLVFTEGEHPPAPLHVVRSRDQGKTWSRQDVVIHPDEKGHVPSMCMNERGITLRHGEHAGRLLRPARWYGPSNAREYWPEHYTNAVYSDDGGRTWHTSAPFPAMGTGEAAVAELADGRIYFNSRRHLSTDGRNPRRRHIAWSHDGGATWEDLSVSEVLPDGEQYRDYGLMAGLVRLPVADRDILIFSNVVVETGARRNGHVWASFDGGRSWPLIRTVDPGGFAYSSLAAGRPGTPSEGWIYLLYETGGHPGSSARMARFNLTWVLQGEPTGDGQPPAWAGSVTNQD